jgi:hypothetical protein
MQLPDRFRNAETSHASLLPEDIFYGAFKTFSELVAPKDICAKLEEIYDDWNQHYEDDVADFIFHDFFDFMNEVAPEGCYFGPLEGDDSWFGFWEFQEEEV